jgi:hypothetical protein
MTTTAIPTPPAAPAPDRRKYPPDIDPATIALFESVEPYTMTGIARIAALRQAVQYVARHQIPGDVVECGVWKGGSMMAVAKTLIESNDTTRTLHLFDTFDGMSEPTALDKDIMGADAARLLQERNKDTNDPVWAYAPLDLVKRALGTTGYDANRINYVQGKVEDTLPAHAPARIALLRLDTDWYESTYHELVHLYPRLTVGGVLIIDDYGHWAGARRAVDQFVEERKLKVLLNRIDYTARMCVKLEP